MGLFSKIKKVFKKVVRKVGRVIKKITKPITKVFKKVLKPIGKLFSKLGWVGTLALGIMLPGIGSAFTSWFGTTFPKIGKFFSTIMKPFNKIVKPFKNAFTSVSETLQFGVDKVAQAFGYEAPTMSFVDGALQSTGATGGTFTDGVTNWLNSADRVWNKTPDVATPIETTMPEVPSTTSTDSLMASQKEMRLLGQEEAFSQSTTQGLNIINKGDVLDGKTITGFTGENTFTPPNPIDSPTWWERNVTGDSSFVGRVRDTKVGNFATFGDIGKGAQTTIAGVNMYNTVVGGGDYDTPFYNDNISLANAALSQTTNNNTDLDQLNFVEASFGPDKSYDQLSADFITGFGYELPTDVPYDKFAEQIPLWGYNFGDHVQRRVGEFDYDY